MATLLEPLPKSQLEQTDSMIHELGFYAHHYGYMRLCVTVPCFARDPLQSLVKDVYPYVAAYFDESDWRAIEQSIRYAILDAWERRDPVVWEKYFPNLRKAPSNKQFIATLAMRFK